MAAKAAKTLPIDEDLPLHKAGWIIQRIGWILMFAFVVLAALGLFGEGPLSQRRLQIGPVTLKYDRFGRYEHGTLLRFESAGETIRTISIPEEYLKTFQVTTIVPQPVKQLASGGDVEFQFEGPQNTVVSFYMMPVQRRTVKANLLVNSNAFSIKQTIYP